VHRRAVRARAHDGVGVEVTTTRFGRRADCVHISVRVHRRDLRTFGLRRFTPLEAEPAACLELRLDRRDTSFVLGMRARVVVERARVMEIERRTDAGTVIRP
jgi:hypothetical protein